ncbi:MAG: SPOR domain-containing protein [Acidobacteria bacterium]|nr:SPOR domain-containing protein [Acidobacteriota bacterium]
MTFRDSSSVLVSRQAVLLATGVGVGMLTLAYVLGVQVGKQTTALRAEAGAGNGELKELPQSLAEQLKAFEVEAPGLEKARAEPPKPEPKAEEKAKEEPKAPSPAPRAEPRKAEAAPKVDAKPEPKAVKTEAKASSKPEAPKAEGPRWTQQLVTTNDPAEAKRVAAKAKEAGFDTVELKSGDTIRVRLKASLAKPDADAAGAKLKDKGLKPFAVKVE